MTMPRTVGGVLLLVLAFGGWSTVSAKGSLFNPETLTEEAPKRFKVKFETTKGDFVVEVTREWAPLGADRFYNLAKVGFYDGVRFFRVVHGYVAQFGIHGYPRVTQAWREAKIEDDPVETSNTRGTLSFATAGKNNRTTQVFINLVDNKKLDAMGFAPIGKVVEGMDTTVDQLYSGYGDKLTRLQHNIAARGNAYLMESFPYLDYITSATIVDD
jgi:peptidyl-prolyl cis-trans isomerase A (cyclophilin A)